MTLVIGVPYSVFEADDGRKIIETVAYFTCYDKKSKKNRLKMITNLFLENEWQVNPETVKVYHNPAGTKP
jgi:hypothetical protein